MQQCGANERATYATQAPEPQRPARAGGAQCGRIKSGGHGVQCRLAAENAETCDSDRQVSQINRGVEVAEQDNGQRRNDEGGNQHRTEAATIDKPAQ
ncbi:hypothetical protein D3C76_1512880 [compost metagenome]